MNAGRYIGRVGGLAIAFGVGTAIVSGAGVASATVGSDGNSTNASSSTSGAGSRGASSKPNSIKSAKKPRVTQTAGPQRVSVTVAKPPRNLAPASKAVAGPGARGKGGPTAPTGSVADLLLLVGTRREGAAATLAADPTSSISVVDGVITGCVATCTVTPDGNTYTVVSAPSNGGKLSLNQTTGGFTFLPYAPEGSTNGPTGTETFKVLVAQSTQLSTFVTGLPLVGSAVFAPLIVTLQQIPVASTLLAPLIGSAYTQSITADESVLRGPLDTPVAFTTIVTSFDGTKISTNFFPASGAAAGVEYESMLYGPGLGSPGVTSPTEPILSAFRDAGYNVITWDPRGEYASGGVVQLDSPQFEGRDVSQLITWVAGQDGVELSAGSTIPFDPQLGMVGVSYGGGIQLVTAATDHRIDAIAPGWSWNSLPGSLYPDNAFKTAYASLLLLSLVTTGATINNQIYAGILTGDLLGILTPDQLALLAGSGPSITVPSITAPTLLIQGTVDVLFPLQQSIINAGYLTFPDGNVPDVKVIWFCGGHGSCLPGQGDPAADFAWTVAESVDWMNRYVKNDGSLPDPNVFEWSDQDGTYWSSTVLPSDPAFYSPDIFFSGAGTGHLLPIIPILGGSGPQNQVPFPYSLGDGSVAANTVNVQIANTVAGDDHVNVVGAPTVTMTYSGVGTSRHVYAQIVDKSTGLVVGNLVSPLPVVLDGQQHTQTYVLNDIAYTMYSDSDLELQIVTTATPYLNLTQYGFIDVGAVTVALPTAADAQAVLDNAVAV